MSLRYLDINPVSTIEGDIYTTLIVMYSGVGKIEFRFVEKQFVNYINDVVQGSETCNTCSEGYIYAGIQKGPFLYNSILKIYSTFSLQSNYTDKPFEKEGALFSVSTNDFTPYISYFSNINLQCDYFSSILCLKEEVWFKYIGKKNGKIGMSINTESGPTFTEYTGEKLIGLEAKNVTFLKDRTTDVYAIFKVGTNLYRYNFQDDFIDDNIILWGILPEDIENFSMGVKVDENSNFQEFYLVDFLNHKYYTATFTDTPPSQFNVHGTINFADGDSVTQDFSYEIHYVETIYLKSGICNFKFHDEKNTLRATISHLNPDSYKYAESITINGQEYPINTKQQITLDSDFTIQVNNGIIANYYVSFKQDETILQEERLEQNTLPVYKGATPTKEGYVFSTWNPEIYAVNKQQSYQATFEKEPYTITIEDEGGSSALEVTWSGDSATEKFNSALIGIETILFATYNSALMYLKFADNTQRLVTLKYTNGLTPYAFIIGETTYNFNKTYEVNITSDTTIKIRSNSVYAIRFLNYDNTVLESTSVFGGTTPTYKGETPYRTGYNFTGWTPTLYPADKNQDYVATFEIKTFTIRFLDDDNTVLETQTFDYGTIPFYSKGTPTKEGYIFNGWSPTPYPANKDQDYKATYRTTTFLITLYKNTAENNKIDKTEFLTKVIDLQGYLRQETNIINPSIIIEYAGEINFNYVYISTFNRYYFVNSISSVRSNLWRIELSVDVLMTYKSTILNYNCYVSRNENEYNEYIEDTYLPLEYEKAVEIIDLYDDTSNGKIFLEGNYSIVCTTIYTGTKYSVKEEEKATVFRDLDGNRLMVPNISLGASNYRCSGIIQNNILSILDSLVAKTVDDDKLASYIISLIAFPVSGSSLTSGQQKDAEALLLKDDNTLITTTIGDVWYPASGVLSPFKAIDFSVLPKYNNFLDYEPYTTYEVYLPFYGWLKLNSYQVVNQHLIVTYVPQVDSEQCSIIIGKGDIINGCTEVIAEVTCQLGIQIPINSTNLGQINREKGANILNSVIGSLSGVAMAGVGVATGNPFMAVAGGATLIGSVTSGISKDMTMQPNAQSKAGSSYDGALGDRIFKLRVTYPRIAVDDLPQYAKFIGRPLQKNVRLSTLTGYTVVGGVHIEDLGTATDIEKTDIENKLRKGVII